MTNNKKKVLFFLLIKKKRTKKKVIIFSIIIIENLKIKISFASVAKLMVFRKIVCTFFRN